MSQPNNTALLLARVRQFTDIEDQTLDLWLALENAGLDDEAARLLDKGLFFEHIVSQVSDDPTKRTPEVQTAVESARQDFEAEVEAANAALRAMKVSGLAKTAYCWKCGAKL